MLNLKPKYLKIVMNIITKYIPEKEVWAFGSRINGKAKKFSDLDLVIVSNIPLNREVLINLKQAFEESDLPIKVDIIEFYKASAEFQEIIKANYLIIFKHEQ